jgi:hypothetical protein
MANIGVRSPYFISYSTAGAASGQVAITVNSTLVYTISKPVDAGTTRFTADVSEFIRGYIQPSYSGTIATGDANVATVSIALTLYNSSGTSIYTDTYNHKAFDAYSYFSEGNNFSFSNNSILMSGTTIWAPTGVSGKFTWVDASGNLQVATYATTDTSESVAAGTVSIRRHECTKYGYVKCVFLNKFGVTQELFFFGKNQEGTSTSTDSYKSNYLGAGGVIDANRHQVVNFNKQGKTKYVLNTGFVGEEYIEFVRELMLSEYVWLYIDGANRPVKPVTSDVQFKTSLNDKMMNYTIEFEQSNDLIANIR